MQPKKEWECTWFSRYDIGLIGLRSENIQDVNVNYIYKEYIKCKYILEKCNDIVLLDSKRLFISQFICKTGIDEGS